MLLQGPDCVLPQHAKGLLQALGRATGRQLPRPHRSLKFLHASSASLPLDLLEPWVAMRPGQWLLPFIQDGLFKKTKMGGVLMPPQDPRPEAEGNKMTFDLIQ